MRPRCSAEPNLLWGASETGIAGAGGEGTERSSCSVGPWEGAIERTAELDASEDTE